jgi:hypothetical protein
MFAVDINEIIAHSNGTVNQKRRTEAKNHEIRRNSCAMMIF